MSLVYITVSGYLGRDPEMKQTQSGSNFLKFSVAASVGYGNDKQTDWYECAIFGKRAESLAGLLHKGKFVVVAGALKQSKWKDQQGAERTSMQIDVKDVDLGPLEQNQAQPSQQQGGFQPPSQPVYAGPGYQQPHAWGPQGQQQGGFKPPQNQQGGWAPPQDQQGGWAPPQNQQGGWAPPDDIPF